MNLLFKFICNLIKYRNLTRLKFQPDCQGTEKLVFLHNVPLPSGVKHWRSFSSGFDKFLIAVTPTVARIYIQREWMYEPLQDLIPNGISGFEDIVPLPVSCHLVCLYALLLH